MRKPAGRRPVPGEKREKLVQFYLTKVDAEQLSEYVQQGKFKGVSTLLTALCEPIIQGGLSVQAAARSVSRIQKFMEKNGAPCGINGRVILDAVRDLFAPPPPIPDDIEDLSQLEADLEEALEEVRTKRKQQTNNQK
jgi:hypothetical protein